MASVATMAKMPIASGSSAATRLPKTRISATVVIGIAIASAICRSFLVWSLTWW